jgi:hypothetical protein
MQPLPPSLYAARLVTKELGFHERFLCETKRGDNEEEGREAGSGDGNGALGD